MAHLMISAAHKSSGKTTLSIGLCAALRAQGVRVQPFKKGPDYIDPLWLGAAAGRPCHNLDFYTQERAEIREVFARHLQGADLGLIEGNKGLYDGLDLDGSNSNAALATLLQAPVVLVLDTRGMTRGVAPLILGYQAFDPALRIAGVILNHVGGSRHEGKLRRVIEHYTDVRVLGALGHNPGLQIEERHLGLMPSNEAERSAELIARLGQAVGAAVDLGAVRELAAGAPPPAAAAPLPAAPEAGERIRIGYAYDEAFGFYYPGDLEALRAAGAELVPFDTLNDTALPAVDALFIGGGFPETRMRLLEANAPMREAVAHFIESGGPAYAECGGLMYLARSLTWNGEKCKMVGVVPADVVMHDRPQGRGYVRLRPNPGHPWPGMAPEVLPGHEFHYSGLEDLDSGVQFAYRVERGHGIDGRHDGIIYKNLLANYAHLRDTGRNRWAARFLAQVRACRVPRATGGTRPEQRG
jgi:cobyrinic acid a,c-diamide synthase